MSDPANDRAVGPFDPAADPRTTVTGLVRAQLPSGLYEVEVEGAHRVTAHIGGGLERNFIRLVIGDRVAVEVTARDPRRGRVVRKL